MRFPTVDLAMRGARLRKAQQTLSDILKARAGKTLARGARMRTSLKSAAFAVLMLVRMQMAIEAKRRLLKALGRRGSTASLPVSRRGSHARPATHVTLSMIPESPKALTTSVSSPSGGSCTAVDVADDSDSDASLDSSTPSPRRRSGTLHLPGDGTSRFFPPRRDLDQFPPLVVQHIENAAARCLARCVLMVRVRRVLNFHKSQRKRLTIDAVPPAALVGTCFEGWPEDAMNRLLACGYAERRSAGEFLYFQGEPAMTITFVLDGSIATLRRVDPCDKRLSAAHNGVITNRPAVPVILRQSAVFVEERDESAVQVLSLTDVIIVPVRSVIEIFETLPSATRDTVVRRCCERRQQLSRSRDVLTDVVRWSPLFACLSAEKAALVAQALEPRSCLAGGTVFDRANDPHDVLFFVARGSLHGVTSYRAAIGAWSDLVFAVWGPGTTVGEKSLYFSEDQIFSLVAATNVDLWTLKRARLMQLMQADRALKQEVAAGAFSVRCRDPSVRLALSTTRNIPCIKAALQRGLLTDNDVRAIQQLYRFAVFPAHELITSASQSVTDMIVLMTGTAVTNALGTGAFVVPPGQAIGVAALNPMRWRYATLAAAPCEGWKLPIAQLLAFLDERGVRNEVCRLAQELHIHALHSLDADRVMTVATPQRLFESVAPVAAQRRHKPPRFYTEDSGIKVAALKTAPPTPAAVHQAAAAAGEEEVLGRKPTLTNSSGATHAGSSRRSIASGASGAPLSPDAAKGRQQQQAHQQLQHQSHPAESFSGTTDASTRRHSMIDLGNVATVDADDAELLASSPRKARSKRLSVHGSSSVISVRGDDASRHGSRRSVALLSPLVQNASLPPELTPPDPALLSEHIVAAAAAAARAARVESAATAAKAEEVQDEELAADEGGKRPPTAQSMRANRIASFIMQRTVTLRAASAAISKRHRQLDPQPRGRATAKARVTGAVLRTGDPSPLVNLGSLRTRMQDAMRHPSSIEKRIL